MAGPVSRESRRGAGTARGQTGAVLAFSVASWRLALPLAEITRVVPLPILQAPLGAPRFVDGFFSFRGSPVAAVRLDRLLGLEEETLGIYAPLIVLDLDGPQVALRVRRVDAILNAGDFEVEPIGGGATFNGCVVGRISHEAETIYLLSRRELLMAEEKARLVAHREMGRERREALEEVADAG